MSYINEIKENDNELMCSVEEDACCDLCPRDDDCPFDMENEFVD